MKIIVIIFVLLFALTAAAQDNIPMPQINMDSTQNSRKAIVFTADLANYTIRQSHSFFGKETRTWNETSFRFGVNIWLLNFKLILQGLALKTSGQDAFGSGSRPAYSTPETEKYGLPVLFDLDQAYLNWANIAGTTLSASIGRQPITVGSQFLIGDGVYDGYSASARQAIFHNPRKWFDAVRLQWTGGNMALDGFIYSMHPTWDGGGQRNGWLGGADISYNDADSRQNYALGLFYRNSPSALDNDMALLNLRANKPCIFTKNLFYSAELVWEFAGTGRNAAYVSKAGQKMNEYAWHFSARYTHESSALAPYLELGYVYYSKDFTPVATGFSDWGKWYLGNQMDWIIFGTDTKVICLDAGLWLTQAVKLRTQYHNIRLISKAGVLSDEFSLIGEWYPANWFWLNVLVGYSVPGNGFKSSELGNPFSWLYQNAVPVGTQSSLDFVLGWGVSY